MLVEYKVLTAQLIQPIGEDTKFFRTNDIMKAVVRRLAPLTPIIVPNSDENPSVKKNPGKRSLSIFSIVAQALSSFGMVWLRPSFLSLASSAAALDLEVWRAL